MMRWPKGEARYLVGILAELRTFGSALPGDRRRRGPRRGPGHAGGGRQRNLVRRWDDLRWDILTTAN
ncbi:MAG: hypothetical protein U0R64_10490 [Candidatus Nanopelagicales bacterium]